MAKVVITREKFRNTSMSEFGKYNTRDLEKVVQRMRHEFDKQAKVLINSDLYSDALDKYLHAAKPIVEDTNMDLHGKFIYYGPKGQENLYRIDTYRSEQNSNDRVKRNKLLQELAELHDFFTAKTSTLTGIKAVQKEQDIRMFGYKPKKGKKFIDQNTGMQIPYSNLSPEQKKQVVPVYQMNEEERRKFWSIYGEFLNQHGGGATAKAMYGSGWTQEVLAEIFVDLKMFNINPETMDFMSVLTELENRLKAKIRGDEYQAWSSKKPVYENVFF